MSTVAAHIEVMQYNIDTIHVQIDELRKNHIKDANVFIALNDFMERISFVEISLHETRKAYEQESIFPNHPQLNEEINNDTDRQSDGVTDVNGNKADGNSGVQYPTKNPQEHSDSSDKTSSDS